MLRVAFVRTAGERDRIYVTRSDGSQVSWVFPTYGDGLPHDLVHLVVESAFGLVHGFWGRVEEGANPKVINDQANRRGGAGKYAAFGPDQQELLVAEALAGARWSDDVGQAVDTVRFACERNGVSLPAGLTVERVLRTARVLAGLGERWRLLLPKGTLELSFNRSAPVAEFDRLERWAALTPVSI